VEVSTAASQFDVTTDITGHIDVLSLVSGAFANEARFLDWKSGRNEESDYYAQLLGYAACLILGHGAERAVGTVVWLRSQTIETFTFTRADALEFVERLKAQRDNPRYSTGGHCAHCPRSHSCEALLAIGRRDAVIFGNKDLSHTIASGVAKATPAELVSYLRRFKVLKKFGEALEEGIRRRIAEEGPLDSGDGYDLSLVEEPGGRDIDTLKAWPVLQERMTDEEIAGCVTVSASKAEDIVAKKTERGYGAEARRKLAEALEEAGAVTHKTRTILREVRRPRVLKERSK
jgi:hypothetical protein